MTSFFDTSALIKKYIHETGSEFVKLYLTQSPSIAVCSTTRVECSSVINRMLANGEMTAEESNYLQNQIAEDLQFYEVIPFSETLEKIAIDMVKKHRLRTLDAIQLASALSVSQIQHFFVSDTKLKESGKAEGLSVIYPNENQL